VGTTTTAEISIQLYPKYTEYSERPVLSIVPAQLEARDLRCTSRPTLSTKVGTTTTAEISIQLYPEHFEYTEFSE
jgi:hypothetical protein